MEQASISCSRKYASQVIYQKKFGKYRGFCVRFDGRLGFPGGLLDPGESIETALNRFKKRKRFAKVTHSYSNREISEEMGEGNPPISSDDWLNSSYSPGQRYFYLLK